MKTQTQRPIYFVEDEYLVTALVPSETACLANSPGRMSLTLRSVLEGVLLGQGHENLRCLDLAGRDGRFLVVCSKLGSLGCNTLEDVVDEGIQDRHGAVGDTSIRVDLLENWRWKSASYSR